MTCILAFASTHKLKRFAELKITVRSRIVTRYFIILHSILFWSQQRVCFFRQTRRSCEVISVRPVVCRAPDEAGRTTCEPTVDIGVPTPVSCACGKCGTQQLRLTWGSRGVASGRPRTWHPKVRSSVCSPSCTCRRSCGRCAPS